MISHHHILMLVIAILISCTILYILEPELARLLFLGLVKLLRNTLDGVAKAIK